MIQFACCGRCGGDDGMTLAGWLCARLPPRRVGHRPRTEDNLSTSVIDGTTHAGSAGPRDPVVARV